MGILSDLIFGLATRKKKCYNSWSNGWIFFIIGTCSKDTWQNTHFSRSQRSKFKTAPLVGTFRYYLT
jgi:hypothetical protein